MSTNDSDHTLLSRGAVAQEAPELPQGSNIDRYVVLEVLGKGGMGVVYKAYDPQLNRGVALKLIRARQQNSQGEASDGSTRLLREAQALAQLNHPNVVSVHDVGTVEDNVFVAMELVHGKTLRAWHKATKPSTREVLEVMRAAGQGLAAAHKGGLIHRDFKPANVIVGEDGRVRVIDFGLARAGATQPSRAAAPQRDIEEIEATDTRVRDQEEPLVDCSSETALSSSSQDLLTSPLTRVGSIVGTPMYMAPEQHLGAQVDAKADQFSFCAVLYELLYGNRPFLGVSLKDIVKEVLDGRVQPPPTDTDVPKWLHDIVVRGLSRELVERFPSMEALLDELKKDPEEVRRRQHAARKRKQLIFGAVVLAAAVPVGVWYEFGVRRSKLCAGAEVYMGEVWNPQSKEKVRAGLIGTGVSYAKDTAERVVKAFDAYAGSWRNMFTETCRATRVGGDQSVEVMDLRMRCLRRRLTQMRALQEVLAEADAAVVNKAVQAAAGLTSVAGCADIEALTAPAERIKPPPDEETAKKVESIRERLLKAKGLDDTGKYTQGLQLAEVLVAEAKTLNYLPVEAEALYWVGKFQTQVGRYEEAVETLENAVKSAGASEHSAIVADASVTLVGLVGCELAKPSEGLRWALLVETIGHSPAVDDIQRATGLNQKGRVLLTQRRYDMAVEHFHKALQIWKKTLGAESFRVALSLSNIGTVFRRQGGYDKAMEYYRNALAIKEKVLGPEHPLVAYALNGMGAVFMENGEYDKALEHYRKALQIWEKALGPEHLNVAMLLNNIGEVFHRQDVYDKAMEYYRKSLAIREKALGPEHPRVAWPLSCIGNAFVDQGRPQQAIGPLERSLSVCEKSTCQPEPHGRALFSLARALEATAGDTERAIELARQAREVSAKTPNAFKQELEEVDAWLKERGVE